jgi:sulfonate transport system substrate-binding protein
MNVSRVRRLLAAVTVAVALLGSLTGCGGSGDGSSSGSSTKPLRVGYQRFGGLSLVKARQAAPGVTWSLFESGPALTEALKAGAIDIGQTGEAPPIFAAAGGVDFRVIGTSAPVPRGEAVLVKESKGFRTFADLKGRTIALNKGSNVNWLLVKLLEKYGLTLDDVDVRYLKPAEGRPAFDNDQVDAWIIWDPYFSLAQRPGVKVLADATDLADNREYLLADPDALDKKGALITSFLKTYRQVTDWGLAHPDERAAVLAPELRLDETVTRRALDRSAQPLAPVSAGIGQELQEIADGFTKLKLIPGSVDIKARIDDRYSGILR